MYGFLSIENRCLANTEAGDLNLLINFSWGKDEDFPKSKAPASVKLPIFKCFKNPNDRGSKVHLTAITGISDIS